MAGRLKYDGDLERGVRKFSLIMTYVMVFFKLFVILVFWKASMDFTKIIKNKDRTILASDRTTAQQPEIPQQRHFFRDRGAGSPQRETIFRDRSPDRMPQRQSEMYRYDGTRDNRDTMFAR